MTTDTRIERLRLTNFRLFDTLDLNFHPSLTVLVAPNGGGKTSILDALAISLRSFVTTMRRDAKSRGVQLQDVRRVRSSKEMVDVFPTEITTTALINRRELEWTRRRDSRNAEDAPSKGDTLVLRAREIRDALVNHIEKPQSPRPDLPAIAYYGTGRLWNVKTKVKRVEEELSLTTGAYVDALTPSSNYWHFNQWYQRVTVEHASEARSGRPSPHAPGALLEVVERAVSAALRPVQWGSLGWDALQNELTIEHPIHGRLPVSWASDGIRNVLGLVGDLAHRIARLNIGEGALPRSPTPRAGGVVLIDEIDMHLRPEWQQVVLSSLRDAFPGIQFIVTTHSPQVLSTVPRECIRILEQAPGTGWRVRIPEEQTEGVASALVMAAVMGVDGTPDNEHVRRLRDYGSLIAAGQADSESARRLRDALDNHFGPHSAAMLECDRVIRLEEMKRRMLKREGA